MDERSESIDSPEKLDAYLQVTKPSMWIVFGGVFLFVIAVILWGTLSSINMTIKTEGYIITFFINIFRALLAVSC